MCKNEILTLPSIVRQIRDKRSWSFAASDPAEGVDCWVIYDGDGNEIATVNGPQSETEHIARLMANSYNLLCRLNAVFGPGLLGALSESDIAEDFGCLGLGIARDAVHLAELVDPKNTHRWKPVNEGVRE